MTMERWHSLWPDVPGVPSGRSACHWQGKLPPLEGKRLRFARIIHRLRPSPAPGFSVSLNSRFSSLCLGIASCESAPFGNPPLEQRRRRLDVDSDTFCRLQPTERLASTAYRTCNRALAPASTARVSGGGESRGDASASAAAATLPLASCGLHLAHRESGTAPEKPVRRAGLPF